MVTPTYMKGRRSIKIHLHSVMDVCKTIGELGHFDQLRKAAEETGAYVTLQPDTVNFIKKYLAENNLHEKSSVAREVVGACPPPDPYHCPYRKEG